MGKLFLETSDDLQKTHGAILESLSKLGYKIQKDNNTRIVAKQSLSFRHNVYGHVVEIVFNSTPEKTEISLNIEHRLSDRYLQRLQKKLTEVLPTIREAKKKSELTILKQERKLKELESSGKCHTCGDQMVTWNYEGFPSWFCVKCEQASLSLPASFQSDIFIGKISRKWNNKTQFFRMKIESPQEKSGNQAAIFVGDIGRYMEMGRGDRIAIACQKDKIGKLTGIFYKNLDVGQEGALISTKTFVGRFKTGRFTSKQFEIPNPKLELAAKAMDKALQEL